MAMKNINNLVGIPYDRMDCHALVRHASLQLNGVVLPDFADYIKRSEELIEQERIEGNWQKVDKPMPGDVCTLATRVNASTHVGIYIEDDLILHTSERYGSMIQTERGLRMMGYCHITFYRYLQ
jgi:cell wall-associated NlpC family hydrolase